MIIYADGPQQFKAEYYDDEGRIVHYAVEFSTDGHACAFVSEATATQPPFRVTFSRVREGQLAVRFEIAPRNDTKNFKLYVEGTARKSQTSR